MNLRTSSSVAFIGGGIVNAPHILNERNTTVCSTEKKTTFEYPFPQQLPHGAMRERCSLVEEDSEMNESWASKTGEVSVRVFQHVSEVLDRVVVAYFFAAGSTIVRNSHQPL